MAAETIIFIQVGENVFFFEHGPGAGNMFAWTMLWCIVGRWTATFSLSALVNAGRDEESKIPRNHQMLMCHAGLRGAIAFALAINFPSHNMNLVVSTTMWIIIFTIFFMGGTTACMLKLLGIETGVAKKTEDEIESDMEEMHASAHPTLLKVHNCLKTVLLRPEVVQAKSARKAARDEAIEMNDLNSPPQDEGEVVMAAGSSSPQQPRRLTWPPTLGVHRVNLCQAL